MAKPRNGTNGGHAKKRVTASDRLLRTVSKGLFAAVDKGFAAVEARLASIEGTMATKDDLQALERRFNTRFDNLNDQVGARFTEHEKRLTTLEEAK